MKDYTGEFYNKLFKGWFIKFRCLACGRFTTRKNAAAYDVVRKTQRYCSIACSRKGESNGNAKLTKEDVLEIRCMTPVEPTCVVLRLVNAGHGLAEMADTRGRNSHLRP